MCALAAFTSYFITQLYNDAKQSALEVELLNRTLNELKLIQAQNLKNEQLLNEATNSLNKDIDDLSIKYHAYLADSLHSDSSADDKASRLPEAAKTSRRVSTEASQCSRDNSSKLQRLYKQQLDLAKQCDELSVRYKRLYELYNSVNK